MTRGLAQLYLSPVAILAIHVSALADPVSIVDSRRVAIEFRADDSPVEQVEVWQTRDEGQTWQVARVERLERSAVVVSADADGLLGFWLVVRNAAGMSALLPTPGQPPQVSVLVDTQSPTLQLHGARVAWQDATALLTLHATLAEENIDPAAIRAFVRSSGSNDAASWRDLGPIRISAGRAAVQLPVEVAALKQIDACISATDLAGNRAFERLSGIVVPAQPVIAAATTQPTVIGPPASASEADASSNATLAAAAPKANADRPAVEVMTPEQMRRVSELRQAATEFAASGQWPLAAARIEEAARIAPGMVDNQLDLGQAFMNMNRLDDAITQFNRVLAEKPDHGAALESLALVNAAQRNYPSARTHLKRLTQLQPDQASHWLRYGDIEFKLGNQSDAQAAWDRVIGLTRPEDALRQRAQQRVRDLGVSRAPQGTDLAARSN